MIVINNNIMKLTLNTTVKKSLFTVNYNKFIINAEF